MAGKININPDAIKRNLDLIIVTVAALGLLGFGWLQLGATETVRSESAEKLKGETASYNNNKNYALPDNLGLTNSPSITTDESHGNLDRVKRAGTNFVAHLDRVRKKFTPLNIPDGIVLDEKTGAVLSVTLMQGGTMRATVRVLNRNGCDVVVPVGQGCCGALNLHSGDLENTRAMARRNIDIFLAAEVDRILTASAGCGSNMKEYDELLKKDPGVDNTTVRQKCTDLLP